MTDKIQPGMRLDVVVSLEPPDVRSAVVYDMMEKHIVISQMTPQIRPSSVGKSLDLSFVILDRDENRKQRWECTARILEVRPDYLIGNAQRVIAIIVERISRIKRGELRQFYRVLTRSSEDLYLAVEGRRVSLVNISIEGAQFRQPPNDNLRPGQHLRMVLTIGKENFSVEGIVIRTFIPPAQRAWQNVSVKFTGKTRDMEQSLNRRILMLEREHLSKQ